MQAVRAISATWTRRPRPELLPGWARRPVQRKAALPATTGPFRPFSHRAKRLTLATDRGVVTIGRP